MPKAVGLTVLLMDAAFIHFLTKPPLDFNKVGSQVKQTQFIFGEVFGARLVMTVLRNQFNNTISCTSCWPVVQVEKTAQLLTPSN